jgi:hypothetical protein
MEQSDTLTLGASFGTYFWLFRLSRHSFLSDGGSACALPLNLIWGFEATSGM